MRVFISLLHNGEPERLARIRPSLRDLVSQLGGSDQVQSAEFSYQGALPPLGRGQYLRRKLAKQRLERQWAVYRKNPTPPHLYAARQAQHLLDCLRRPPDAQQQQSEAIEVSVTDKHVRAWDVFLESGADYLLGFEDDAVFRSDSIPRLIDVLNTARAQRDTHPVQYWDLAGGFPLDQLGIDQLIAERTEDSVSFAQPVTNTTCSYLLSRPMVQHIRARLVEAPNHRLFPVDWMLNRLFIDLSRRGVSVDCRHFTPPILDHGSITGAFASLSR